MKRAVHIEEAILAAATSAFTIKNLCKEVRSSNIKHICVPPLFVKLAKQHIAGAPVHISTVIGFPFGYSAVEAKLAETVLAIVDGADELEIVVNTAAIKSGDWQYLAREINSLFPVIQNKQKQITIIIESSLLTNDEIIKCCDLYGISGVNFLKLSTGYCGNDATLNTAILVRKHLADAIGIKIGAIKMNEDECLAFINAGVERIAVSNALQLIKETATKLSTLIAEKQ